VIYRGEYGHLSFKLINCKELNYENCRDLKYLVVSITHLKVFINNVKVRGAKYKCHKT